MVFTTRLATEKDHQSPKSETPTTVVAENKEEDIDEEEIDVLIGRKKLHNDGDPVPLPMAHAPYFPEVHIPPPLMRAITYHASGT